MTTKEQDQIIIKYLLDKKLSVEVAAEVYDHMIVQIDNLQHDDNLSFDEAWMKTKESWLADLKMSYDVLYSMDDISEIMKKLTKKRWIQDLKQTFPKAIGLTIILNLIFVATPKDDLIYFRIILLASYFAFIVYSIYDMRNYRKAIKKFNNHQLLLGQNWAFAAMSSGGLLSAFFQLDVWNSFYESYTNLLAGNFSITGTFSLLYLNLIFLFISYIITASLAFSKRMKKTLAQIQPFLNKIEDKKA